MPIPTQSWDEIYQQTENSLQRLNELCQRMETLQPSSKQDLLKALAAHNHTLKALQVKLAELRQHNQELAVTSQLAQQERQQVEERTDQLTQLNQHLEQEIAERQRVEAVLRQQTQWERLRGAISQRIYETLNLDLILNTTVAEIRQFFQADRVVIYQVEANGDGLVVAEAVEPEWTSLLGINISTALFKQRTAVYRQGSTLVIHDMEKVNFPTAINQFLQQQQVKASVTVPILHGEKLWGLLAIHQCAKARQWEQLEVDLITQLATQISIAIQQSELYQQVLQLNTNLERQIQERTAQLQQSLSFEATLKRITDDVRDSLDERQILQTVVWELAVVLNIDGCDTGLYDTEESTSTISYEYTVGIPSLLGQVVQMSEFSEGYNQLLQGQYFQFCSLVSGIRGAVVTLACPIFDNHGCLGDLWLFKPQEEVFNELEIRLVQQVANQCAIAIRQARLYQASQAQVKELEKLNRLKDDFLSTVSHELRTPVANMKMAIQMLGLTLNREYNLFAEIKKPAAQQSKIARYFQILHNECERETHLINDLLDLQRLYAGVQALVLTSIHLQEWLPQIVEPFEERARNHQLSLRLDISPEIPRFICDPSTLGRIVAELLDNACKYTPPNGEIIVTSELVTIEDSEFARRMQLTVSNSGIEIPASELPRIFDKFYRIPNNDPWKQGGTGLGLALVQQLVTHLKGTIHVESKANLTRFILQLPLDLTG